MSILFDATVLSNFARAGGLVLLQTAYPDLKATAEVIDELRTGEDLGYFAPGTWDWLTPEPMTVEESAFMAALPKHLGSGEASCVAAAAVRHWQFFSDDLAARLAASQRGIRISGSVGVLIALVKQARLTVHEADDLLQAMRAQGYRSPVHTLLNADMF